MQPDPSQENQPNQPAPPPPPPAGGGGEGAGGGQPSNGLGTASMVVGIVSIPLVCCFGLGGLTGIVGVVLGFLGKGKAGRGEATNGGQALAGIICGFVAIGLALLWAVLGLWLNTFDADMWADVS